MTLVVDASVALKWFVEESGSNSARSLFRRGEILTAPDLVIAEVCNAAWKLARQGSLDAGQFEAVAREVEGLFDRIVDLGPLAPRAAHIAQALGHPVYDCFYLALAERSGCHLVTADRRLRDRLERTEWSSLMDDLYRQPSHP